MNCIFMYSYACVGLDLKVFLSIHYPLCLHLICKSSSLPLYIVGINVNTLVVPCENLCSISIVHTSMY